MRRSGSVRSGPVPGCKVFPHPLVKVLFFTCSLPPSSSSLPPPSLIPHPHSPESAHPGNTTPASGRLNPLYPRTLRLQKDFQKILKNTFPRPSLKIRISRLRENARIPQGRGEAPPLGDHLHSLSNTREIRISSDGLGKGFFGGFWIFFKN